MAIGERIGERIRVTRKEKGLSQKELGKLLGVSGAMIGQYETGQRKPRLDTLQRIASALGVDWLELVPEVKRSAIIITRVMEKADLTVKDKDGNVIRQGSGKPWRKLSTEEAYRLGILNLAFNSEEDRIAYFYSLLNTDGKLAASKYFYQNLDKDRIGAVADYVEKLSEIPQYQRLTTPQSTPAPQEGTDTTPEEKPFEDP